MAPELPATPQPRPAIASMHPYEWEPPSAEIARQAGVPEEEVVRFDTNTFPWPGAALDRLPPQPLNEYPDTSYGALTEAIGQYADVPTDWITVGAGADEVLDMVGRSFIAEAARAVISRPTYPMFTVLTELAGGALDAVPAIDLHLDRSAFVEHAREAKLTWLANPNNPTGELVPLDFIEHVAASSSGVVVVDEAYYELSGVTAVGLIDRFPNLVVVRTLSKGFSLAGARVGYALAGPSIGSVLRRVRPPGSVSVTSAALGVLALQDVDGMRQRVALIKSERERLRSQLTSVGFEVRESAANFLLLRTGRQAAPALLREGLVVRTFASNSPLADYIRVTVRRPEQNARLVSALQRSPATTARD
ncbi:MAG TPA: histidinol-phosphate transaminase [Candidatus Dormibacteraeota bacterium]